MILLTFYGLRSIPNQTHSCKNIWLEDANSEADGAVFDEVYRLRRIYLVSYVLNRWLILVKAERLTDHSKGRKFNARKETPDEKYLNIQIYRFYIRCTRCSGEITFKTDPMNMDYVCERGARRNFEAWRPNDQPEETVEERLDRLEEEEADGDRDAMVELETKAQNLKSEEKIADALDAIRVRNAERNRVSQDDAQVVKALENNATQEEEGNEEEIRDAHLAKEAFRKKRLIEEEVIDINEKSDDYASVGLWKPVKKQKKTGRTSLLPGIVRKV